MSLASPLGIFGGTFDPIHNGHIYPILQAAKQTHIESVALMPNYLPGHKQAAHSSAQHRLAMAGLVCQAFPLFYPEPWEIEQQRVSYTIDTLLAFRDRFPERPLCFFIGSDSLYNLPAWHRWQELPGLCHFIVCQRQCDATARQSPHWPVVEDLLARHQTTDWQALHQHLNGCIFLARTTEIHVSSTQIRAQLAKNQAVAKSLPDTIYRYIEQHKLYQHFNKL